MRQLLMILIVSLAANSVFAFQDAPTHQVTAQLLERMEKTDNKVQRLRDLEKYKDWIYQRLNSIELPENFISLPDNSPILEEYRSLTEYDNYINLIRMKTVTEKDCAKTAKRIEGSTSREGGLVPEASDALRVLTALCN